MKDLQPLLKHPEIWRAQHHPSTPSLSTGLPQLDQYLPTGGWPQAGVTEIFLQQTGVGELCMVLPTISQCSQARRQIFLVDPPYSPYAPALLQWGIDLQQVFILNSQDKRDALWAMQQCLQESHCVLLAWPQNQDNKMLRRLQLASELHQSWAILFYYQKACANSYANLRLQLDSHLCGLRISLLKAKGNYHKPPLVLPRT